MQVFLVQLLQILQQKVLPQKTIENKQTKKKSQKQELWLDKLFVFTISAKNVCGVCMDYKEKWTAISKKILFDIFIAPIVCIVEIKKIK